VDAPAFGSVEEFSAVLGRFEQGSRSAAVKGLIDRGAPVLQGMTFPPDPRRVSNVVTELRRELRSVEVELYEQRAALNQLRQRVPPVEDAGAAYPPSAPLLSVPLIDLPRDLYETEARLYEQRIEASQTTASARAREVRRKGALAALSVAAAVLAFVGLSAILGQPREGSPEAASTTTAVLADREPAVAPPSATIPTAPPPSADVGASALPASALVPTDDVVQSRVALPTAPDSFSPSFGTNGSAIFFHSGGSGDPSSALMSADQAGGELQVMSIVDDGSRNYHVQLSPDGRQIAFDSDRDGERGVYVANRDGSDVRRVSGEGYAAVPSWAPDGRRLTFVRGESTNTNVWNLWLLDLTSGKAEPLTEYRYGQTWGASWFKDNRRIAYSHEDTLSVLDLPTGARREFRSPVSGRLLRTPAVSPDGRRIIFQVHRDGGWLLDLEQGSMRRVLTDPTAEEFAWAPDGRRVAYHSRQSGQWGLWMLVGAL
jgi:hypothetical protein